MRTLEPSPEHKSRSSSKTSNKAQLQHKPKPRSHAHVLQRQSVQQEPKPEVKQPDQEGVEATPTLAPRRAYSMEVIGKWTQIVRQTNVKHSDSLDETETEADPKDPRLLVLARLMAKRRAEQKQAQQQQDQEDEINQAPQQTSPTKQSPPSHDSDK